jgi:hypothetical protein
MKLKTILKFVAKTKPKLVIDETNEIEINGTNTLGNLGLKLLPSKSYRFLGF